MRGESLLTSPRALQRCTPVCLAGAVEQGTAAQAATRAANTHTKSSQVSAQQLTVPSTLRLPVSLCSLLQDCPEGTYTEQAGSTTLAHCVAAPKGSFAEGTGNDGYTPCEGGTFQNEVGQSSCKVGTMADCLLMLALQDAVFLPAWVPAPLRARSCCYSHRHVRAPLPAPPAALPTGPPVPRRQPGSHPVHCWILC
jgi:hypothetical protein